MTKNGIDVSEWQGNVAWGEVSKHVDFAILRAGYGRLASQVDKCFHSYYSRAKAAGLPLGAYWYSYAKSADEAKLEATACIEVLKGKQFEYPIYFDVEEQATLALGRETVSAIINAFCAELEKAGYFVGVYMSANPLTNLTTEQVKKRYAIWVANYGVSKPNYSGSYGMWQKLSEGKIDGIAGNVDIDECYVDYPAHIINAGDNGFPKHTPEPQKKQVKVTLEIDDHTYSGLLEER